MVRGPSHRHATLRRTAASAAGLACLAFAIEARADACAGKSNGWWCDGNNLLVCKNGAIQSSQNCPSGCQSMPSGVPDQCKSGGDAFCGSHSNGWWCDGDTLKQCSNGSTVGSTACQNGCQQMPVGVPDKCKDAPQPTGFCANKSNGWWCDGDTLKQCGDGNVTSQQGCQYGCQSNAAGVPDQCKSGSQPSGACAGKSDGKWCSGAALLTCSGGNVADSVACAKGCVAMPAGVPDQCASDAPGPTGDACSGKADGQWCSGSEMLTCGGGAIAAKQTCDFGCVTKPAGVPDECAKPPEGGPIDAGFCGDKVDGDYCDGGSLVTCQGTQQIASKTCQSGCVSNPAGVADVCAKASGPSDPCAGKSDGQYCNIDAVVLCKSGKAASSVSCGNGCIAGAGGAAATCSQKSAGFCVKKGDGLWCDGDLLTTCAAGKVASATACPKGCAAMPAGVPDACKVALPKAPAGGASIALVVQEAGGCASFKGSVDLWGGKGLPVWDQQSYGGVTLGTCPGLTIGTSGCTITSLSMLHAYLGLHREVDGKKGSDPVMENAWRTTFNGYDQTWYWSNKQKVWGDCIVDWGKTPGGLAPQQSANGSSSCLSKTAADTLAASLNAGMPVVVGVHWADSPKNHYDQETNWHWVLVVGADSGGLWINDPWGGKERVRLAQGGLGSYVVDAIVTFHVQGLGGAGLTETPIDERGDPISNDQMPSGLTYVGDGSESGVGLPRGPTTTNRDTGSGGSGTSTGCVAAPAGDGTPWVLVSLAILSLGAVARRRGPGGCP